MCFGQFGVRGMSPLLGILLSHAVALTTLAHANAIILLTHVAKNRANKLELLKILQKAAHFEQNDISL